MREIDFMIMNEQTMRSPYKDIPCGTCANFEKHRCIIGVEAVEGVRVYQNCRWQLIEFRREYGKCPHYQEYDLPKFIEEYNAKEEEHQKFLSKGFIIVIIVLVLLGVLAIILPVLLIDLK